MAKIRERAIAASAAATVPLARILNTSECRAHFAETDLQNKTAEELIIMLRDAVGTAEIAHSGKCASEHTR